MAVLLITNENGGKSRSIGMTVVPQPRDVPAAVLQRVAQGAGVNGVFLADTLSAFAMHERAASRFAIAASRQASTAALRELHETGARAHLASLQTMEALMQAIGLDPLYASPAARMTGYRDEGLAKAPLLAGSVDPLGMEIALLDVAISMAGMTWANVRVLEGIATGARPSALKNALQQAVTSFDEPTKVALEKILAARQAIIVEAALAQK